MYEESIRVPLFVHCPDLTDGECVVEDMVLNIDIAPTILEAAQVPVPSSIYGKSFFPVIAGTPLKDWRKDFLYQYFWEAAFPMTPTIRGLRTEKYSYIKSYGAWDIDELYDIEADPHQTKNLIGNIPLKRVTLPPKRYLDKHLKDPKLKALVTSYERRIIQILADNLGVHSANH